MRTSTAGNVLAFLTILTLFGASVFVVGVVNTRKERPTAPAPGGRITVVETFDLPNGTGYILKDNEYKSEYLLIDISRGITITRL